MIECPICGADVSVAEDALVGEIAVCLDCGTELEITDTNPLNVFGATNEEEDWGE